MLGCLSWFQEPLHQDSRFLQRLEMLTMVSLMVPRTPRFIKTLGSRDFLKRYAAIAASLHTCTLEWSETIVFQTTGF
jgi:hypothetical protein